MPARFLSHLDFVRAAGTLRPGDGEPESAALNDWARVVEGHLDHGRLDEAAALLDSGGELVRAFAGEVEAGAASFRLRWSRDLVVAVAGGFYGNLLIERQRGNDRAIIAIGWVHVRARPGDAPLFGHVQLGAYADGERLGLHSVAFEGPATRFRLPWPAGANTVVVDPEYRIPRKYDAASSLAEQGLQVTATR